MSNMKQRLLGLAAYVVLSAASAQTLAPVAIPPPNCEKPVGGPGPQPNYEQQKRFEKRIDGYKECVNKYAKEMRGQAEAHFEAGKRYVDAGNAAIDEYNAFVTELNAQQAARADPGSAPRAAPPAPPPQK